MHYRSPTEVMEKLKDEPESWLIPHPFIFLHRSMIKRVTRHVCDFKSEWMPVSWDTVDRIREYLKENLCLDIASSVILEWLSLYPFEAAILDDIDTFIEESLDALLDMVSHYYLNSWWPADADNITDEAWIQLLEKSYKYFKRADENSKPSMWAI